METLDVRPMPRGSDTRRSSTGSTPSAPATPAAGERPRPGAAATSSTPPGPPSSGGSTSSRAPRTGPSTSRKHRASSTPTDARRRQRALRRDHGCRRAGRRRRGARRLRRSSRCRSRGCSANRASATSPTSSSPATGGSPSGGTDRCRPETHTHAEAVEVDAVSEAPRRRRRRRSPIVPPTAASPRLDVADDLAPSTCGPSSRSSVNGPRRLEPLEPRPDTLGELAEAFHAELAVTATHPVPGPRPRRPTRHGVFSTSSARTRRRRADTTTSGLSHNAIRQHLARLVDAGLVERDRAEHGRAGCGALYRVSPTPTVGGRTARRERLTVLLAEARFAPAQPPDAGRSSSPSARPARRRRPGRCRHCCHGRRVSTRRVRRRGDSGPDGSGPARSDPLPSPTLDPEVVCRPPGYGRGHRRASPTAIVVDRRARPATAAALVPPRLPPSSPAAQRPRRDADRSDRPRDHRHRELPAVPPTRPLDLLRAELAIGVHAPTGACQFPAIAASTLTGCSP